MQLATLLGALHWPLAASQPAQHVQIEACLPKLCAPTGQDTAEKPKEKQGLTTVVQLKVLPRHMHQLDTAALPSSKSSAWRSAFSRKALLNPDEQ